MRTLLILGLGTLISITGQAAPATGTVYRVVQTDTNGVFIPACTNIPEANGLVRTVALSAHLADTNNPHAVTAAQAGADPAGTAAAATGTLGSALSGRMDGLAVNGGAMWASSLGITSNSVNTNTLMVTQLAGGDTNALGRYTWGSTNVHGWTWSGNASHTDCSLQAPNMTDGYGFFGIPQAEVIGIGASTGTVSVAYGVDVSTNQVAANGQLLPTAIAGGWYGVITNAVDGFTQLLWYASGVVTNVTTP